MNRSLATPPPRSRSPKSRRGKLLIVIAALSACFLAGAAPRPGEGEARAPEALGSARRSAVERGRAARRLEASPASQGERERTSRARRRPSAAARPAGALRERFLSPTDETSWWAAVERIEREEPEGAPLWIAEFLDGPAPIEYMLAVVQVLGRMRDPGALPVLESLRVHRMEAVQWAAREQLAAR